VRLQFMFVPCRSPRNLGWPVPPGGPGPHPAMLICFETFRQQERSEEPPLAHRSRFKPFLTVRLLSLAQ